ncbi:hypothetical protein [Halomonas sp. HL-93]|uniref:hypothetical protein n=1 Tax=Halomonas sp. HL-93 TaxID=1666906 RepID=UPI0006DB389D|nr:hypothetical protein [Halomonas sp. HL-93]KPQ19871.1 MAG: hypothetical protein HLUCCO06_12695 [Halomonas sp. HL-93]SBR48108.1 hypothetical protein GA0071314_1534 [Halomonas sp. HL-93]
MSYYEDNLKKLVKLSVSSNCNDIVAIDTELLGIEDISNEVLNDFYRNLEAEYECFYVLKFQNISFLEEDDLKKEKIINLISWVIETLENWEYEDLYSFNKLAILFNVTSFLDENGSLWKALLSNNINISGQILAYSKQELSRLRCEFNVEEGVDVPIHERESLERFLLAISNKNFEDISEMWRLFNNRPLLSYKYVQMLCVLDYFKPSFLVSAFEGNESVPILMHIMLYIRVETAFFIGFETKNDYLEFSSVYSTLSTQRDDNQFTEDENKYLTKIFNKVGDDGEKFVAWMNVFNKYVVRYPKIQVALGRMLANTSSRDNVKAYIKSISISKCTDNYSRKVVTECLKEIVICSDSIRRKDLWCMAYEAWSDWNFGGNSKNNHIFSLICSELDFAIIGYIKECLTEEERLKMDNSILSNLRLFESKWHDSSSSATTYWYHNLSYYQIIAHAGRVDEDIDKWLLTGKSYIPSEFHENDYIAMLVM